ncbi:coenzyme F420-0:L-glutamate ligase [Candidatus Peregrinibacteria bacterium]|nr:coenzyme F420-0:L-glutamate ligase [Candidatus Peregrinibacteria bacterium]
MQVIPIKTPTLCQGDDLAEILTQCGNIQPGDILVVSSKAVATIEGAAIDLATIVPTTEARAWAKRCGGPPAFRQAILSEVQRMHGVVLSGCPLAMLTELKPDGLTDGTILAVNAGLDRSNVADGYAIGWPRDPISSVRKLKEELKKELAVILSDSCCRPRRIGVVAMAIAVAGIDPIKNQIGSPDLFGHPLQMTQEAIADQLATAANIVMGNAGQSIPAAIIRDHHIPFTTFAGWVPGIVRDKDLFCGMVH